MNRIEGTTLILTGATGGIGRALAARLAGEKVNLVLNARNRKALEEVAAACGKAGTTIRHVAGSAASGDVADAIVREAVSIGNFHGFIHAAGVLHPGPLLSELPEEYFNEIFEASVTAAFRLAKAAFPQLMREGRGTAVFFGSGAAEIVMPGIGAYCSAKAAEEHLARQLAAEAPEITTFIFRPGVVDTPMVSSTFNARGSAAAGLRKQFTGYRDRGELLSPDVPARALVNILKGNARRFHGKIASWRDGQP